MFIVYIIGVLVYCIFPLGLQIPLLLLNTVMPDPIPCLDEIIMYGSTIKKIINACEIFEWMSEHKALTGLIIVAIILLIIVLV